MYCAPEHQTRIRRHAPPAAGRTPLLDASVQPDIDEEYSISHRTIHRYVPRTGIIDNTLHTSKILRLTAVSHHL